jgi:hypothetical protein
MDTCAFTLFGIVFLKEEVKLDPVNGKKLDPVNGKNVATCYASGSWYEGYYVRETKTIHGNGFMCTLPTDRVNEVIQISPVPIMIFFQPFTSSTSTKIDPMQCNSMRV